MKDVRDDDVDRRQVQGVRALQPSRTNDLKVAGYDDLRVLASVFVISFFLKDT